MPDWIDGWAPNEWRVQGLCSGLDANKACGFVEVVCGCWRGTVTISAKSRTRDLGQVWGMEQGCVAATKEVA